MTTESKNEFVRNDCGVAVKKCCSSCAFKGLSRDMTKRWCTKKKRIVKKSSVCKKWQMNEQLKGVGKSSGQVKRREYLKYLVAVRQKEQRAMLLGKEVTEMSIEEVRRRFEGRHGSIFLNF